MEQTRSENRGPYGRRTAGLLALAVFAAGGLLVGGCRLLAETPGNQAQAEEVSATTIKSVTLPIEGMSCAACTARVKKALKSTAGVKEVEVSLGERLARIKYLEGQVTPEQLASQITELGYRAGTPAPGG